MQVVYAIQIDLKENDWEHLPSAPSIGFAAGSYNLSTAPLPPFCDCLDRNSFSDISQENMILHGGELSLTGDVKIKIVSRTILEHILQNDIELLGCKVSMSAYIGDKYDLKKDIFEKMLITGYFQADEVSIELNLSDSAFANAGQLNLKVPQGYGGSSQIETSYGGKCLLKLYKQDRQETQDKTISQGLSHAVSKERCPEFEILEKNVYGTEYGQTLLTRNGVPAFSKNFRIRTVHNIDEGQPAVIEALDGSGFTSEMEGKYIEICSGRGKGSFYRIIKAGGYNSNYATLDRPINTGDISVKGGISGHLQKMPAAGDIYMGNDNDSNHIFFHISNPGSEDLSVFRFCGSSSRCAVPKMKNMKIMNYPMEHPGGEKSCEPNVKIINSDGSLSDACIKLEIEGEESENYDILTFPSGSDNKIVTTELSKYQPRWRTGASGTSFWRSFNLSAKPAIHVVNNQPVAVDSGNPEKWETVAEVLATGSKDIFSIFAQGNLGLQASLYWRVDDLLFDGKCKLRPKFSFRMKGDNSRYSFSARALLIDDAGIAIATKNYNLNLGEDDCKYGDVPVSLGSEAGGAIGNTSEDAKNARKLQTALRNLFVFETETSAKYIYLQLFFTSSGAAFSDVRWELDFAALPAEIEREVDVDKLYVKGYDARHFTDGMYHGSRSENIADRTAQLCLDCGIEIETRSFTQAGNALPGDRTKLEFPFIPFKHGDNFPDKLAEICRAANFSMYSDGSRLHAFHPFRAESIWVANPGDVIKGSLEARAANSVAMEWEFLANTWDGQKTLSLFFDASAPFPVSELLSRGDSFRARLRWGDYMDNPIKGFGARIKLAEIGIENFQLGGTYWVRSTENGYGEGGQCELVSLAIRLEGGNSVADALFVAQSELRLPKDTGSYKEDSEQWLEITPLRQERSWRELVCGNLDIGYESAEYLYKLAQTAFAKTKKKAKLDERYSKHKIAAFGSDEFWLQNFLKTAKHNSFSKHIFSFKVPIDRLPLLSYNLCHLLLRQITLAFGRFKRKPLNCWIVGYSFSPAEDAVRLEVMNSEPMESPKQTLCLDENLLKDQLTIDEREHSEEFYSEA